MNIKILFLAASLFTGLVSTTQAAEKLAKCSLYVADPIITHTDYGQNDGPNKVNSGVIRILQNNGFTIVTNSTKARFSMFTEVRCGRAWTMFGLVDACQTEVIFENNVEDTVVYTNGPTALRTGLNINFDAITFPSCSDI